MNKDFKAWKQIKTFIWNIDTNTNGLNKKNLLWNKHIVKKYRKEKMFNETKYREERKKERKRNIKKVSVKREKD